MFKEIFKNDISKQVGKLGLCNDITTRPANILHVMFRSQRLDTNFQPVI